MKTKNTDIIMQNNIFGWIALITGVILSIPFIAMQFTTDVDWDQTDFIVMGALLFGMQSLFVFAARKIERKYWPFAGIVFFLTLLYLWVELAVGIFTNLGS